MEKAGHWGEFLEVYCLRLFCLCFLSTVSEHLALDPLTAQGSSQVYEAKQPWTGPYGSLFPLSCVMCLCHSSRGSWHSRLQAIVCSGLSLILSQGVRGQKAGRPGWSVLPCAKLYLESPENDILGVLMSCCPEMGQVGFQRQKQEAQGFIPWHGIAQDAVQKGRQVLLPWISTGRAYRMWPRAKVSFCSFSMFDLSAFWTTT